MNFAKFLDVLRKNLTAALIVGLVAGILGLLAIRFFTYNPTHVHYHANFEVFINGQRELFKDASYYEEVGAGCSLDKMTPGERAHMHDEVNNVVHVHDRAVTWANFLENIGWTANPKLLQARGKVYLADKQHKVTFVLNGEVTDNIANQIIGDKDRLLIDYGNTPPKKIRQEFKSVPSTATKYDASKDPASCGGSAKPTTSERLHHLF